MGLIVNIVVSATASPLHLNNVNYAIRGGDAADMLFLQRELRAVFLNNTCSYNTNF